MNAAEAEERKIDCLSLRLNFGALCVENCCHVTATGSVYSDSLYMAVATSDGQIRFFVEHGDTPQSWIRVPFRDFNTGKRELFPIQHVAIGGDCSPKEPPSLLAFADNFCAYAFEWDAKTDQWRRIGTLKRSSATHYGHIESLQWEQTGDYTLPRPWSLYVGGNTWGHQQLRQRRWYERWRLRRWVCTKL